MRDELELAAKVADTHLAGQLQARAYARIEKYLAPSWWERRRGSIGRAALALVGVVLVFALLGAIAPEGTSQTTKTIRALALGAVIGLLLTAIDAFRDSRAIRRRADEQVDEVTSELEHARAAAEAYRLARTEAQRRAEAGYTGPPTVEDDEPLLPDGPEAL